MRSRIFLIRRLVAPFFHQPFRTYKKPIRCDAHMNELPVPCGPWSVYYKNKQKAYTKVLIAGALWFFFSFIMMIWTNSLFLNFSPPIVPGPPSEKTEECDDEDIE